MSTEALKGFFDRMAKDQDLRDEVIAAAKQDRDVLEATPEIAARHGFEFSRDELDRVLRAAKKLADGEVSEEELEAVVGGAGDPRLDLSHEGLKLTLDEMRAAVSGRQVFQDIKFAPPYVPVGPDGG